MTVTRNTIENGYTYTRYEISRHRTYITILHTWRGESLRLTVELWLFIQMISLPISRDQQQSPHPLSASAVGRGDGGKHTFLIWQEVNIVYANWCICAVCFIPPIRHQSAQSHRFIEHNITTIVGYFCTIYKSLFFAITCCPDGLAGTSWTRFPFTH